MPRIAFWLLVLLLLEGCKPATNTTPSSPATGPLPQQSISLPEARRGFNTKLLRKESSHESVPAPPADLFRAVHYDSAVGKLAAYLSLAPQDGKRHPAMIWIEGGAYNMLGPDPWTDFPENNDQSARAFREAGIVTMYPGLRGGNGSAGVQEGFFGEVDDVLAAADYLGKQAFVDPNRIYLGGHSTGGTLVLLVAESSPRFRAVFSFGPVADVGGYPPEFLPFDTSNRREIQLRSPGPWLNFIKSPVFAFEGATAGNLDSLQAMSRATTNPQVHFYAVQGATHFSILAPVTRLVAQKILRDEGPAANITFSERELNELMTK